jgi:site-specific DNA-methyltransferase (adenine-specific)
MIIVNKVILSDYLTFLSTVPYNYIDLIIIDPPYVTTKEKWDKNEVVNDLLSQELFRVAKDSCSLYVWCGIGEKSQSLIRWFPIFSEQWFFKDLITWKKTRGIGMRRGWLYAREECMWFVKNNKEFIWNIKNQYSEEKSQYTGMGISENGKPTNQFGKERLSEYKRISNVWADIPEKSTSLKTEHFTPKPEKAIERIISLHTKENDIVLDCFMGSGTTGIVSKKLKRSFVGCDNNKEYVDMANERIMNT